jgi:ataxia telangiectasia mutated family protein
MGLVRYEDVADAAASILGVSELTAPAIICDSSIELVRHLLTLTSSSGAAGIPYGHTVIRWFFMKWNIGEFIRGNFNGS